MSLLASSGFAQGISGDQAEHHIQFIAVGTNVKLEVLDWGGSGRPVILLAGLGNDAHVYDQFAPKLTASYHVYGITRRGFGASSHADSGYSADRLGDDVIAVIDSLKLNRPVLVGHSIGGEELSSVGSRHPEKVAGLIYLDAGYSYAYYADAEQLDRAEQAVLPQFEKELRVRQRELEAKPAARPTAPTSPPPPSPVAQAIIAGGQRYTNIPVPILAIYAAPHDVVPLSSADPAERAVAELRDAVAAAAQAKAFETGVPTVHAVLLAHASHYVFRSNEGDVLREMSAFLRGLKP